MTKEEVKQKLRKNGYKVAEDNSVVTVLISQGVSMKNTIKDIKERFATWGYDASFAIKQHNGNLDLEEGLNVESASAMEESDEISAEDKIATLEQQFSEDITAISKKQISKDTTATSKKQISDDREVKKAETNFENDIKTQDIVEDEYFDEEDSDMLLTESSIQFSLEDFGLDF